MVIIRDFFSILELEDNIWPGMFFLLLKNLLMFSCLFYVVMATVNTFQTKGRCYFRRTKACHGSFQKKVLYLQMQRHEARRILSLSNRPCNYN